MGGSMGGCVGGSGGCGRGGLWAAGFMWRVWRRGHGCEIDALRGGDGRQRTLAQSGTFEFMAPDGCRHGMRTLHGIRVVGRATSHGMGRRRGPRMWHNVHGDSPQASRDWHVPCRE
eukprot:7386214-Prymnesium_polylepis.1